MRYLKLTAVLILQVLTLLPGTRKWRSEASFER